MDDYGNHLTFYFSDCITEGDWNKLTNRWYVSTATYEGVADHSDCADI